MRSFVTLLAAVMTIMALAWAKRLNRDKFNSIAHRSGTSHGVANPPVATVQGEEQRDEGDAAATDIDEAELERVILASYASQRDPGLEIIEEEHLAEALRQSAELEEEKQREATRLADSRAPQEPLNIPEQVEMNPPEVTTRPEQLQEDQSLRAQQDLEFQASLRANQEQDQREEQERIDAGEEVPGADGDFGGEEDLGLAHAIEASYANQNSEEDEIAQVMRLSAQEAELEAAKVAEATRVLAQEAELEATKAEEDQLAKRERSCKEWPTPGQDATANIAVKPPSGPRMTRKFSPEAKLAEVYAWVHCLQYLPEGRDLEIPQHFMLKTTYPRQSLNQMNSSIKDLQLQDKGVLQVEAEDDE